MLQHIKTFRIGDFTFRQRDALFLALYSFVLGIAYLFAEQQIPTLMVLFVLMGYFVDKLIPLCIYIMTTCVISEIPGSMLVITFSVVGLSSLKMLSKNKKAIYSNYPLLFLYMIIVLAFSYFFSRNTNTVSTLNMVFALLTMFVIATMTTQHKGDVFFLSLLIAALLLLIIVSYQQFLGVATYSMLGKLQFAENSKALAYPLAVLVFFLFSMIIKKGSGLFIKQKIFIYLFLAWSLPIFLMTYSRGVTIALMAGVFFLLIKGFFKGNLLLNILTLVVAGLVTGYFIISADLDTEIYTSNIEGGNGRTEIWSFFLYQMLQEGCLLYGFGSGSMRDVTVLEVYSHSAILDYFFSYGILGLIFITGIVSISGYKLYKEDVFYFSLFTMVFLMFSTHGTSSSILFSSLMGLCLGAANRNDKMSIIVR